MSTSVVDRPQPDSKSAGPQSAPYPPEFRGVPILGLAWPMRSDPLGTMERLMAAGGGDLIRMKLGPYRATLVRNPDHVKRVLVDKVDNYTKQTRGFAKARIVLGDGLVTSEGSLWQRQRRIATPAFHRQRIAAFGEVFTSAAERMVDEWKARADPGSPLDVFREMMRVTLKIALQTLMGVAPEGKEIDELSPAVTEVLERTNDLITNPFSLPPSAPTPKNFRLKRAIRIIDRFVYDAIDRKREIAADLVVRASRLHAGQRPKGSEEVLAGHPTSTSAVESHHNEETVTSGGDLLSMLLEARDADTGEGMSDRQLRDEAVTILIAGHETTANALTWAFHLMGENPHTAETLREELDTVLAGRLPTFDDLPKLKYTRAVIEESMRLYPPAWMIGRACRETDVVGGYRVDGGTFMLVSPYMTHRHPGLWDNPTRFDPMRFIDGRSDALPKFSYLPFGGGPRFCIGATFAMMEAVLILATVARRVRFEPVAGFPVVPYAMITLRPKHGLKMRIAETH